MDFYQIKEKTPKRGIIEIYPDFKVGRSKDLMIRGESFYAIWNEETGMWSTDEYDVATLIDKELYEYSQNRRSQTEDHLVVKYLKDFSSGSWVDFQKFIKNLSDNSKQLNDKLTFLNTEVKKSDYVSRRLNYPLEEGTCEAYNEMVGTLYSDEERAKLEWAIGAIISGDSKTIQKFIVLYGEHGTGKSTILNIIQKLFDGYYSSFEAKALTGSGNSFSMEIFKTNPLVAIQHDGDLSRIEDNTKLNSIVSHEVMTMNEKFKAPYMTKVNAFLFLGTNKPVKITDAKSGLIRRLIDVHPSGNKIPVKRYHTLMQQIDFELGAIAYHCLEVYRSMGKNYYNAYRPLEMMFNTDVFFNFVEASYFTFSEQDYVTLKQAYEMYKIYCDDSLIEHKLPLYKFRAELKSYFKTFSDVKRIDGAQVRSVYQGFLSEKFQQEKLTPDEKPNSLVLDKTESILDEICKKYPAQYANTEGTPKNKWADVKTTLSKIDTSELHYLKLPINHIVIDFDLKDENGEKSLEKNLEAASKWPPTYAEYSKSGKGVHLHYIYDGDTEQLNRLYDVDIEIKVFVGNSSLRRKLTFCNDIPIATINSGLPMKGVKMINFTATTNEKAIRKMVENNLKKEYHPGTKPSIDFIHKILEDAYDSGIKYDIRDLRPKVLAFANNSNNQAEYCIKLVNQMKFNSDEPSEPISEYISDELVFFDVEVFPNLFIVCWKPEGKQTVTMINPTPSEIEGLLKMKLVGFNCRRYDNHILYARYIGYTNSQLYDLSQKIINDSRNALFGEAYNISYTDIYDFSSVKQSLKKFQIELGIHHQELGMIWTEPVPEDRWLEVAEYCVNDVITTEQVFNSRKQDYIARLILSDLSGLTPNDSTQQHTAKIIFGNDPRPQDKFIYTDLSEMFPGYKYEFGQSSYRGEDPKEGGYVYAEPGMYANVALLDVASMHPTSLIELNHFGPYTKNFKELKDARLAIKHKDFKKVEKMLGGILTKYLGDEKELDDLAYALKIIINIVYGLTSAKFDNKFKDPRNVDNIVAKRGALFMIDLKHAVQEKGFTVTHIKTDSIKIPNATKDIIDFVTKFGKKYGYEFEHELTYSKFCLVNDAVYIAKTEDGKWDATGAQFAQPYVYKTLFSKEKIDFRDKCETKTVKSALYLDMNEELQEVDIFEKVKRLREKIIVQGYDSLTRSEKNTCNAWESLSDEDLDARIAEGHNYHFVGKAGEFCPIKPGYGGGILLREKDGKYYAATGTKGYRWLESEVVRNLNKEQYIDISYYDKLVEQAIKTVEQFGNFDWFVE